MAEINFYNIDCIEFMKTKPDKYYDLAIVDPPYGININNAGWIKQKKQKKIHQDKNWDAAIPPHKYFKELKRISKNQIIWGGNYFNLPPTRCFIIWDKVCRMDQADCEMAWTSFNKSARIFTYAKGNESGFAPKIKKGFKFGLNIHPTQKPIALYRWLLQNYATHGDKILDTHGGSMSSAIASDMEGFDLDICEIDNDYFEAGVNRFNNHKQQLKLFQ